MCAVLRVVKAVSVFVWLSAALPPWALAQEGLPTSEQLIRGALQELSHRHYPVRISGYATLAHLGRAAEPAIPALLKRLADAETQEERQLIGWTLARIGTDEAKKIAWVIPKSNLDPQRVTRAREAAPEISLRMALSPTDQTRFHMNAWLPLLYNAGRSGNAEEKLFAAWALLEINTGVTIEDAEKALRSVAEELDPKMPDYNWHLRLVRLVGPRGLPLLKERLRQIVRDHDFGEDVTHEKPNTVRTLAFLTYPGEDQAVTDYLTKLADAVPEMFSGYIAQLDASELGAFACGGKLQKALVQMHQGVVIKEWNEELRSVVEICEGKNY